MTATTEFSTSPIPDALHAALGRLSQSLARLDAVADRQVAMAESSQPAAGSDKDVPGAVDAERFARTHAEALRRLGRAEQLIRAVAGRLSAAEPPAMEEAS